MRVDLRDLGPYLLVVAMSVALVAYGDHKAHFQIQSDRQYRAVQNARIAANAIRMIEQNKRLCRAALDRSLVDRESNTAFANGIVAVMPTPDRDNVNVRALHDAYMKRARQSTKLFVDFCKPKEPKITDRSNRPRNGREAKS